MWMWFYYKMPPNSIDDDYFKQFYIQSLNARKPLKKYKKSLENIDFVLVYNVNNFISEHAYNKFYTFLINLEKKGLLLEYVPHTLNSEIHFIKIYIPRHVVINYANIFNIELGFQNLQFRVKPRKYALIENNQESFMDFYDKIFTINHTDPSTNMDITSAERCLIIYYILRSTYFGILKNEYGLDNLINNNIIETAYALHDGPCEWKENEVINDRQLLARIWSKIRYFYKPQPLNLIEKYYGPEIALYFAWTGFYTKLLIIPAFVGLVCFILGAVIYEPKFNYRIYEVCKSDKHLCPKCQVENCGYELLKNYCFHAHLINLFDNPLTLAFSALMSIWATVFLELWTRQEAILQIRWNLRAVEMDLSKRPEFEEQATHLELSKVTGQYEPYIPSHVLYCRYAITTTLILFWLILLILTFVGVLVYNIAVTSILTRSTAPVINNNVAMIAASTGATLSLGFIFLFESVYSKVAFWLTRVECHRTQTDFDNSFIFKSYAFAFINNYTIIFYVAFVKARFYTFPGDKSLWTTLGGLDSNLCDPAGCIIDLGTQLVIILFIKNVCLTSLQYFLPKLKIYLRKLNQQPKLDDGNLTLQWEKDYLLNEYDKYSLIGEYIRMIIQYGFVIFFVAAFPLAPLFAFINNLIELRVDAQAFTTTYRRPIAFKVPNIGAWNGILKAVTYIGVATNAFVIAFTSEFVEREIFTMEHGDLQGFVDSKLSEFKISELPKTIQVDPSELNISFCYYPGKRYPPGHPRQYKIIDDYWYELAMKFVAVVVFEHVVMIITGFVSYSIPDMPFSVKQHLNQQKSVMETLKKKEVFQQFSENERQQHESLLLDSFII